MQARDLRRLFPPNAGPRFAEALSAKCGPAICGRASANCRPAFGLCMTETMDRFNYEYLILRFGYPTYFAGTNNCGIAKKTRAL